MDKLCFIISSMHCGGSERVMSELVNYAAKNDFDVTLILLHKKPIFYKIDSKVKIIEPAFGIKGVQRIFYALKIFSYIRKNVKLVKPSTILSFGRVHNPYVLLSLIFTRYHIFVSDRGNPYYDGKFINEQLRKIAYKWARGIISQTEFSAAYVRKTIRHKNVVVIPNPLREVPLFINERQKQIIFVGRLIKTKGVTYLLDSFAGLRNNDWKVAIVGDGPEKKTLEEQANKLGIIDNVIFHGFVDNVDSLMSQSEIFAFPSLSEGFPNGLVEAMANGLACVSFNCKTGPSDVIKHGFNGFLVNVGDVITFRDRIQQLIDDESLRKQFQYTSIQVREEFKLEKIAKKYLDFINEVK